MSNISYTINDPTTPELTINVELPIAPEVPVFKIEGYIGGTPTIGTPEHQAASCHVTMVNGINVANKYLKNKMSRWSSTNVLHVQPRAGQQLNAFYDRQSLKFFFAQDPSTKELVYAVNSTDVVSHELGHAILDYMRPDLFNVQCMEIWAFHESFGDINAILNTLHYDIVLDYILKETSCNLRQSNVATRVGEQMGGVMFHMTNGRLGHSANFLRNACNTFTYTEPEKLSKQGMDTQITAEPHSFSRVFTGAWYDILVEIYEDNLKNNMQPKDALISARDVVGTYIFQAMPIAAATIRFYDAVARAILVIDKSNNYKYNEIINKVFISRNILREVVKPMMAMDWESFKCVIGENDEVLNDNAVTAVRNKNITVFSMPIQMMNVATPADTYYEFDESGNCVSTLSSSNMELVQHADECVNFLMEMNMIRPDHQTPFELDSEGNLKRSHFSCGGGCGSFSDNCTNPQAPEYQKCWKIANNSGCACGGKTTVVVSNNSRKGNCITAKPSGSSTTVSSNNIVVKTNGICKNC